MNVTCYVTYAFERTYVASTKDERFARSMERLSVDRLKADEKLIEVVKRFPCLWETHSKAFRDLVAKDNAWKVVSSEVGPCVLTFISFKALYVYFSDCLYCSVVQAALG